MSLPPDRVKQLCRQTLPEIGIEPHQIQNGIDFYKYFYLTYPCLRGYLKDAENVSIEQIQKSSRFATLGTRLLLSNYLLVSTYENLAVFRGYIRDLVDRHEEYEINPKLWGYFHIIFVQFLETKKSLNSDEKKAWIQLGKDFSNECNEELKRRGLPHI
uniref:Globin family profile domain-containing protein n=1 Tax=Panagrolaimus sp. JU765 TaxID=591449 RepID=A0AC34QVA4_9BILA